MTSLLDRARDLRRSPAVSRYFPPGWVRAVGFEYATLVGLVWGLPLSKGRVRREGDLIILTGLPRWAFRRGGTTVGRVYLTRDNDGEAVLRHEAVHVEQWRKYGFWMPFLYALAGPDAKTNRFEIEAGLEDGGYVSRKKPAPRTRSGQTSRGAQSSEGSDESK